MKPHGKMHQPFLGLGGELWEQPADKTTAQTKPLRWLSLSKPSKVANIFGSWATAASRDQIRPCWNGTGDPRASSATGFCWGSGYHSQLSPLHLVPRLLVKKLLPQCLLQLLSSVFTFTQTDRHSQTAFPPQSFPPAPTMPGPTRYLIPPVPYLTYFCRNKSRCPKGPSLKFQWVQGQG